MLELIERLEAAKPGVDLVLLEPDVHLALFGGSLARAAKCPRYLRSLDAALALAERVLPGCVGTVSFGSSPSSALIYGRCLAYRTATASTPALALVIATLKAVSAKGGEHG